MRQTEPICYRNDLSGAFEESFDWDPMYDLDVFRGGPNGFNEGATVVI